MIHGKAGVLPVDETGGQMRVDQLFLQEKLDDHSTEVLRHLLDIPEGNMDKLAPRIEAALQHDAVEVRVPPREFAALS